MQKLVDQINPLPTLQEYPSLLFTSHKESSRGFSPETVEKTPSHIHDQTFEFLYAKAELLLLDPGYDPKQNQDRSQDYRPELDM